MFRHTHATVGQNQGRVRPSSVVRCQWQRTTHHGPRTSFVLPPRSGISLTEVLIAMGILTIGLLGVAAIFPVGSYYMQQGEIANRGSAIAQAAFNEVVTNGTLNPENWLVWEDGSSVGPTWPPNVRSNSFHRPFAERLRRLKAYQITNPATTPATRLQQSPELEFGSVFVIDPMGVASVAPVAPGSGNHLPVATGLRVHAQSGAVYPGTKGWRTGVRTGLAQSSPWYPWSEASVASGGNPCWPIRRVTLAQPTLPVEISMTYKPLEAALAEKQFSASDDLSLDVPTAQNKPAVQPWLLANLDGSGGADDPIARQSRGNYSWIVTVSPTTAEARDALATDPSAYEYEVSVVVFYKRPIASTNPSDGTDEVVANADLLRGSERAVQASIVSTGLNGGEVLLERYPYDPNTSWEPEESPFNVLKTGRWVLLCGPHPNSSEERPMMVARWYRVLAIDGKDRPLNSEGNYDPAPGANEPERRLVSLRGPQWPWQPASYVGSGYSNELSNSLYVCIPAGAVAVHAKTIRLEGKSIWGGGGTMPAPGEPPRWTTGGN